jgi:hypothetical protein
MLTPHPLDILFLTNFSDHCFRSIPAVAQMADAFDLRLTIMHVYDPKRQKQAYAEEQVSSFFPEADRYSTCFRLTRPGPLVTAVRQHLDQWPVNLIVAPSSDPVGLPRLGDRSMRARLLEACGVPVWTIGRKVESPKLRQAVRRVACWMDGDSTDTSHVAFALEYALKLKAELHLLRDVSEVHEAALFPAARPNKAVQPDLAKEELLRLLAGVPIYPKVHVTAGSGRWRMPPLLRECDADIVFLRSRESLLTKWFGLGLQAGDSMPCPAVYVGEHLSIPAWNLETRASSGARQSMSYAAEREGGLAPVRSRGSAGAASVSWLSKLGLL